VARLNVASAVSWAPRANIRSPGGGRRERAWSDHQLALVAALVAGSPVQVYGETLWNLTAFNRSFDFGVGQIETTLSSEE